MILTANAQIATRDWAEVRFRYLADVRKGRLPSTGGEADPDAESAPYLTMEYLRGENTEPTLVSIDPALLMASAESVLLLWDGSNAGEFLRAKPGVVSSTSALVTPKCVVPKFFFWACKAQENRIRAETVGMGIPHVNGEFLANLRIRLPTVVQQRAIADYLDRETARLDALVAEKERVLGLLAEKRRALITCAVTRGLDPRAPLRDSGVPWLGEIPSHWFRVQLRRFTNFITSGSRGWAEHYSDSGSFFVRIGNLTRDSIQLDLADAQYVDPPEGTEGERTRIQPGDLLFSITAYLGSIAVAPVGFENAFVSQHIALVRLARGKGLDPVYAGYTALSEIGQSQLVGQGYGGTKTQLALDDIRELWFPVPPLPEQIAIVRRIERATSVIDGLYSATTRTLALLRERRDSLIAAAVTGQLQVT